MGQWTELGKGGLPHSFSDHSQPFKSNQHISFFSFHFLNFLPLEPKRDTYLNHPIPLSPQSALLSFSFKVSHPPQSSIACVRISFTGEMKGMKGRFLKKLKFMPTISNLKQGLVLQLNPQQTFSNQNFHNLSVYQDQDCKTNNNFSEPVVDFKDHKDVEAEVESFDVGDQDNVTPLCKEFKDKVTKEDNSQLPTSFETVVKVDNIPEVNVETEEEHPCLADFEEKCPPGGEESVIFYTTSLRGIRKTFEDCSSIRFLLDSFKILVHERDVSMDMEFREELWRLLGGRVIPPKLFIKGRYIGGADEVVGLHEQGKLKKLFDGIPSALPNSLCTGCANMKFLVCRNCNGSRKVFAEKEGDDQLCMKCPDCNENGLAKCPVCC